MWLVLADGSWLRKVLGLLMPLPEANNRVEWLLLDPFPHSMEGACCNKPSHRVGYSREGHVAKTLAAIHHVQHQ